MSVQNMELVKKWWFLLGSAAGEARPYIISGWDHAPSQDEVDHAVSIWDDEQLATFYLLEETSRGRSSVNLKPLVDIKKLEGPKPYKMPPLSAGYIPRA